MHATYASWYVVRNRIISVMLLEIELLVLCY